MSYDITYEEKNGKILVQCDRGLYKDIMKNLAGRWNTKFAGFLLPIEKKEEIKALIEGIRDAQKEENEEKEENNQREEKDDNINTRFEPKEEDNREIISDEKRIERETDNEDRVENNKELKSNEDQVERETDTNEYRVERESDNNEDQVESNQEFKPNEDQVESNQEFTSIKKKLERDTDNEGRFESNQEFTSIKKKLERDTDNEGRFESNQEKDHKINSQYDLEYDDQIEEFTNPKKNLINDRDIEIDNEIISSQNKFQSINQRMPPVTQKFVKENLPSFMDSEDDELDNNFIPPKRGLLQKKEPKVQTKPEPKVQYKPEPKVQYKHEPKVQTKPEPKVQYKPEPKVQYKPEPKVQYKPEPKVQYKPEPKVQIKKEFKVLSDSENESFYQPPIKNKKVQTPSPSEYSDVDYNEYSDDEDNQDEDENGEEEYEEGEESESDCEIEYSKYVPPSKRDSFRKEERIEQPKNVQSYFQDKNRLSSNQKNSSNKYTKEEKEKLKRKVELLEIKKAKKYGKTIEEVRGERKQTNIRFQDLINKVLDLQQRLEEIEFQLQQKNRRNY